MSLVTEYLSRKYCGSSSLCMRENNQRTEMQANNNVAIHTNLVSEFVATFI